jgi:predicted transcriptional regulator
MLDLTELIDDWNCPTGDVAARVVTGRDGVDLVQMRIELGLLQMFPDGRPDAATYGGLPGVLEFLEARERDGQPLPSREWQELERELLQRNFRRIAFSNLAEQALQLQDTTGARVHLTRALRDTASCLAMITFMREHGVSGGGGAGFQHTLLFHHARHLAQLLLLDRRGDEAIDALEDGISELESTLVSNGVSPELLSDDVGLRALRDLSRTLRKDHHIPLTLRERLDQALEREDFELATILRDQLAKRDRGACVDDDETIAE